MCNAIHLAYSFICSGCHMPPEMPEALIRPYDLLATDVC
jgi:hypothetical protein